MLFSGKNLVSCFHYYNKGFLKIDAGFKKTYLFISLLISTLSGSYFVPYG